MPHNENLHSLKIHDNDKYLALHFVSGIKKQQLAALFNFHYLVAQIAVEVSEPMIGMIKFQWWRDVLEEVRTGHPPRPHPVLLGLQHSNVNYAQLETVVNAYEGLLENQLPTDFAKLDEFVTNTQLVIFQQAANIMEGTDNLNSVKAYAYNYLARQINSNKKSGKFATQPEVLVKKLVGLAKDLAVPGNSVFDVITEYYNRDIDAKRWPLLLKLAFSRAVFL